MVNEQQLYFLSLAYILLDDYVKNVTNTDASKKYDYLQAEMEKSFVILLILVPAQQIERMVVHR